MPLPLLPTKELDLTNVDRQGLVYRAQYLARQVIPNWTDFSLSFPENVLLEGCALIVSMAISVMKEQFRQHALATMTDRLAAIRKGRITNYQLQGATAAQVDGVFRLPNSATATVEVTIPSGTRIQSGGAIYTLYTSTAISVGNNASPTVTLENSEDQELVQLSEEMANITIQLSHTDVVESSIAVTAGNGAYSSVNADGRAYASLVEANPDDRAFIIMRDNNGRAYVFFGNGINGAIPQGTITITYRTGGGEAGRAQADAAWTILDGIYDVNGQIKTVEFYNPSASVGGFDASTVEEARIMIPQSVRTLERAVNEDDFEFAAVAVAGVARAALMTSNHDSAISEDEARLYLIAYGTAYSDSGYYPPASPTAAQKLAVTDEIDEDSGTYAQMMGLAVTVYDPVFTDVNVKVKIYKESNYTAAQVKAAITQNLQKFFAVADADRARNALIDFGCKLLDADGDADYKLAWSKVFNVINDTVGVREISASVDGLLLNDARASVVLSAAGFPRLGTVTVYDVDQGGIEI
jgi:hypothetical protein